MASPLLCLRAPSVRQSVRFNPAPAELPHPRPSAAICGLPLIEWELGRPEPYSAVYLPSVLRNWHRASLLGIEVGSVAINRSPLAAVEIERVNDWLSGRGAWRLASADYWHARRVLESVVGRSL